MPRLIPPPTPPRRLTRHVSEVAEMLGVAPRTLYDAINRNELKCVTVGTRRPIALAEDERLIGHPIPNGGEGMPLPPCCGDSRPVMHIDSVEGGDDR